MSPARCQALLDDAAVLAAMCYVDLNPIRAGLSESFQVERELDKLSSAAPAEHSTGHLQPVLHYLALVDRTGRQVRKDKRGYIPDDLAPILSRLGVDEKEWVRTVMEFNICLTR